MKFARTHKILSFVLAGISSVPVLVSGEMAPVFTWAFAALFVLGWFVELPLTAKRGYRRFVNGVVIAIFAFQMLRFFSGTPMAGLGIEFISALLGLKMCSRARSGDYQQIAILSFLHIIAGTVVMLDVLYAGSFIVFVVLVPAVLAIGHLRSEMEARYAGDDSPDAVMALKKLLQSRRIISARFLMSAGFLALPVLLMTAVLFITFPRIGLGLLGRIPSDEKMVGFTDQVTLGDVDLSRYDGGVVFRFEPLLKDEKPPAVLPLKFRGAVLDHFEDGVWSRSRSGKELWGPMPRRRHNHILDPHAAKRDGFGLQVYLDSYDPSLVFVPEGTGIVETDPLGKGARYKPRRLSSNSFGMIRYNDENRSGLRYRAYLTGTPPWGAPPDGETSYLQIPAGMDSAVEIARGFAGEASSPRDIVTRLVRGLRNNYGYSRKLSADPANVLATTPLERFLVARKTGTCEHFATALTIMARAQGIPARVITGFSQAEWNPIGGYYAVRQRAAHAWTEVFFDGRWHTADATPRARAGSTFDGFSRVRQFIDAIEMAWQKHVIGYDATSQMKLAIGARSVWVNQVKGRLRGVTIPRWVWGGVGGVVVLFALWWWRRYLFWHREGGHRPRGLSHPEQVRAVRLYHALENLLGRDGLSRLPTRTPLEHLEDVRRLRPSLGDTAQKVTQCYHEVRFGGRRFGPGEFDALWNEIRAHQEGSDS